MNLLKEPRFSDNIKIDQIVILENKSVNGHSYKARIKNIFFPK